MDKVVRKFSSHEEAEAADIAFYRGLTPTQRLEILCEIIYQANGETFPGFEKMYRIIRREPR